jgi:hypothetical protein
MQRWLQRAVAGSVRAGQDVQQCDVQCLTLFFQRCALGTAGGKNKLKKHTTSNLDMRCLMFNFRFYFPPKHLDRS